MMSDDHKEGMKPNESNSNIKERRNNLEIACFNAASYRLARSSKVDRIELCVNQSLGGTTPPASLITSLDIKSGGTTTYVMIRPRGGDFIYTYEEYTQMEKDITTLGPHINGFVFGILNEDGRIDAGKCQRLIEKANGLPCTFHRAFDEISEADMLVELEVLIECGFKSVLTSGGKNNAVGGAEMLTKLVEAARGRIDVIVGGGVRSSNLDVLKETGATWFHSSAIIDGGETANEGEVMRMKTILEKS